MATRAIEQNRKCLLISFSINIEVLDLSEKLGLSNIIEFLKKSFYGGTDAGPALRYAVNMMKEKNYKKSDLLMISDFLMQSLDTETNEMIKTAKEEKNKFYSLAIGDFVNDELKTIFDDEWIYDPVMGSVHSIKGMVDTIQDVSQYSYEKESKSNNL